MKMLLLLFFIYSVQSHSSQPLRYFVRVEPNGHVEYLSSTIIPILSETSSTTEQPYWRRNRVKYIPEARFHYVTKEPLTATTLTTTTETPTTSTTERTTTDSQRFSNQFNRNSFDNRRQFTKNREQPFFVFQRPSWNQFPDRNRQLDNRVTPRPFVIGKRIRHPFRELPRTTTTTTIEPRMTTTTTTEMPTTTSTARTPSTFATLIRHPSFNWEANVPVSTRRFRRPFWTTTRRTTTTTTTTQSPVTYPETTTRTLPIVTTEPSTTRNWRTFPTTTEVPKTTRYRFYERVRYTLRTAPPFDYHRANRIFSTFIPAKLTTFRPYHYTRTTPIPETTTTTEQTTEIPATTTPMTTTSAPTTTTVPSTTTTLPPTTTTLPPTTTTLPSTTTTLPPTTTTLPPTTTTSVPTTTTTLPPYVSTFPDVVGVVPKLQPVPEALTEEIIDQIRLKEAAFKHEDPMEVDELEMNEPDSSNVGRLMEDVYQLQYEVSTETNAERKEELKHKLAILESQLESNLVQSGRS